MSTNEAFKMRKLNKKIYEEIESWVVIILVADIQYACLVIPSLG